MSSEKQITDENAVPCWSALVAEKRAQCHQKIPESWRLTPELLAKYSGPGMNLIGSNVCRECKILSEKELDITENYTARQLVQRLASRELSALSTVTAFSKRAAIAQQLVG